MTLQFTVLELSCLLHIRLQEELVRFAMKKTYSILHVLFSNSSLFENEEFGEGMCTHYSISFSPFPDLFSL